MVLSGGALLNPDGVLKGNLGEEILLKVIDHPKMDTVKASKGKEVEITSDGIIRCEVYDLSEDIKLDHLFELRRDLNEQPNHP